MLTTNLTNEVSSEANLNFERCMFILGIDIIMKVGLRLGLGLGLGLGLC